VDRVWLHWWNVEKDTVLDDGHLPPGTPVRLESAHHRRPPDGYEVYELIPKLLAHWRGYNERWVAGFGAVAGANSHSSVYWSDLVWELAEPRKQDKQAVFRPQLLDPTVRLDNPAPLIRCGALFIERMTRSSKFTASVDPSVEVAGVTAHVGEIEHERGRAVTFQAQAAKGPRGDHSALAGPGAP
jgi:hypothetical protein